MLLLSIGVNIKEHKCKTYTQTSFAITAESQNLAKKVKHF